jgi:parallel beta-helix repeat protein
VTKKLTFIFSVILVLLIGPITILDSEKLLDFMSSTVERLTAGITSNGRTRKAELNVSARPSESFGVSLAAAVEKTYYVASDGNDLYPGTEAQPFRTMKKGVSVLKPGDTLYVKKGTYVGSSQLRGIPSGSSWAAPVTIAAYPGHRPVIISEPNDRPLYFVGNHHIIIDGFSINAKGSGDGIKITYETGVPAAHHIRIKNSEIKNANYQGILVAGKEAQYNEFINLNVHHNGFACDNPGQCHGIYIDTDNNLVDGGSWYNNQGYGIHVYSRPGAADVGPSDNIVKNALVHNNGSVGIGLVYGVSNHAYNNIVYRNKVGISVLTTNGLINKNTVYDNPDGGIVVGFSRNTIRNNIIYSNERGLIVYPHHSAISDVIVMNNLAAKNGQNFADESGGGVTTQGNLFGDVYDPGFINFLGQEHPLRK